MITTSSFRWREGTRAKKHVTTRAVDRACFYFDRLPRSSNFVPFLSCLHHSGLGYVLSQQLNVYWLTLQVKYILNFLKGPLRSSVHGLRIDTPAAAEIPSVELSSNEHTILGSIALAVVPPFQGHSPMAVWQTHLHWHTWIGTPPILPLHHLQKVFKGHSHVQ